MACHLIIEDCCCDFELSEGLYREHERIVSSLLVQKCFVIQTFFITNAILKIVMENIESNISSSEELVGIDEVQKFLQLFKFK